MLTLVADDDSDQRALVRRLFARIGVDQVLEAGDGAEALQLVAVHAFDLIILDLAMPRSSGLDVLPELRHLAPQASIVVLSNAPRSRLGDLALERGATGYVEKRVRAADLVREVLVAAALTQLLTDRLCVHLPAEKTAPRAARRFVREALEASDGELLTAVELLVSELVTNAVVHTATAPTLQVELLRRTIRIEVHDDDPTLPLPRLPDVDSPGGRGLGLVEQIASRWGAEEHAAGKVVWFEIDRPQTGRPE